MHLHYLRELSDYFEIVAVADLSPAVRRFVIDTHCPGAAPFSHWEELLDQELDAVLVLTPTSHAPISIAAAARGHHIFCEKPIAFSVAEAMSMVKAAEAAGVCLMVGYMKRFDAAYCEFARRVAAADSVRLVRVTTLEAPVEPYVAHYPLALLPTDIPADVLDKVRADDMVRLHNALGTDANMPGIVEAYRMILLDGLVHEFNMLRDLFGEPTDLVSATIGTRGEAVSIVLMFGTIQCVLLWADLPELVSYRQELAVFTPRERLMLRFPSPYRRNAPTQLLSEHSAPGPAGLTEGADTISLEEPFKLELLHFYHCATGAGMPRTHGLDAARDIALARAIVRCHVDGAPVPVPTALEP
jgi:predicted dehydrogenase